MCGREHCHPKSTLWIIFDNSLVQLVMFCYSQQKYCIISLLMPYFCHCRLPILCTALKQMHTNNLNRSSKPILSHHNQHTTGYEKKKIHFLLRLIMWPLLRPLPRQREGVLQAGEGPLGRVERGGGPGRLCQSAGAGAHSGCLGGQGAPGPGGQDACQGEGGEGQIQRPLRREHPDRQHLPCTSVLKHTLLVLG